MPRKTIVNGLIAAQHRLGLGHGSLNGVGDLYPLFGQTDQQVGRTYALEADGGELSLLRVKRDRHHLRMQRRGGDVAKRGALAHADYITRRYLLAIDIDAGHAEKYQHRKSRKRQAVPQPNQLMVPDPQGEALPDIRDQHDDLERDSATSHEETGSPRHAHREALGAFIRIAAFLRAHACDPSRDGPNDQDDHGDA